VDHSRRVILNTVVITGLWNLGHCGTAGDRHIQAVPYHPTRQPRQAETAAEGEVVGAREPR